MAVGARESLRLDMRFSGYCGQFADTPRRNGEVALLIALLCCEVRPNEELQ
jgi:hypothetical protein